MMVGIGIAILGLVYVAGWAWGIFNYLAPLLSVSFSGLAVLTVWQIASVILYVVPLTIPLLFWAIGAVIAGIIVAAND